LGPTELFEAVQKTTRISSSEPPTRVLEKLDAPDTPWRPDFRLPAISSTPRFARPWRTRGRFIRGVAPWQSKKLTAMGDQLRD